MRVFVEGFGEIQGVGADGLVSGGSPTFLGPRYGGCFHPPTSEIIAALDNPRAIELLYMAAQLQHEQGLIK